MALVDGESAPSPVTMPERLILVGSLIVFVAVNCWTASLSPTVWMDEVLYTDPAYHLATTGHFTSDAWDQPSGRFFAGNVPLYPFMLAGWIKVVGFGSTEVRSLSYVLAALAIWIAHSAIARSGWLRSARMRLTFVGLLLLGYGMAVGYRSGRPDALTMLVAAGISWGLTLPRGRNRFAFLVACSAVAPIAGLQLAPFLILAVMVLLVAHRRKAMIDCSAIAFGGILGAAVLFGLYSSQSVWLDFRNSVLPHAQFGERRDFQFVPYHALYQQDWSLLPVLFIAVLAIVAAGRPRTPHVWALLVFAALAPAALQLTGKYPTYYCWMAFAPAAAAACIAAERLGRRGLILALVGFVASAAIGLPARLGLAALQFDARDYRPIEAFVRSRIGASDVVFCHYAAYYPARSVAREVYVEPHARAMTDQQRQEVTVVFAVPNAEPKLHETIGGSWVPTGAVYVSPTSPESNRFRHWLDRLGAEKYQIAEYRRLPSEVQP